MDADSDISNLILHCLASMLVETVCHILNDGHYITDSFEKGLHFIDKLL
jgi:hypothetical protein